ncbi:dihydroorotase [Thioflexithrix psekupsensis]|uniref:Dihydroorotase n=1 Tax=Thioflexithrix psekupsensis TaxID=1570016 RepID=A0A251X7C5_9GAMM|nr:dihydroorotase [Thioflexithrix psekupsensis]OUD13230.1 dihydroorotase [Thioflexithrix psekupsensis]
MSHCFSLCGGRVIDPASRYDAVADVHVKNGRIVGIGDVPDGFVADWALDVTGQVVCPGLVDLCVRLREPGAEHKGTIRSETRAAACSGITTLCCPPDNTPVTDTPAVAELLQQRAELSGMAKVLPLAALTKGLRGEQLSEMGDLREAGCVGVSNALQPVENSDILRHALEYAANCDLPVFLSAQDAWLGRAGCVHEGAISTRLGLPGIPEAAETIEIARIILLIELTQAQVHFSHLSTARAVEMIARAQAKNLRVSADVCAHQLFLTDMDITDYNSQCHVYPPLRSMRDRDGLREALRAGLITAICSDHQPHERDAKLAPFAQTAPGISALDTLLPLTLRLAEEMGLDWITALGYVTCGPADILGIDAGRLRVGGAADICVFDPQIQWELSADSMHSLGLNSPFLGWLFQGRVTHTIIDGRLVFQGIGK